MKNLEAKEKEIYDSQNKLKIDQRNLDMKAKEVEERSQELAEFK